MGPRGFLGIVLLVVLVAGAAGLAYNAGVAHGLAQSGQTVAPPGGGPYPYGPYYGPYMHGPFGFGFFGLLFPLLFIFLFFGLLRGLFWHSWGGYGHHWGRGVPPEFEEWHRRVHEGKQQSGTV
jgi:hypothetical protein